VSDSGAEQIILLRGGLGNQLFQIAMGLAIEKDFNRKISFSDLMLYQSPFSRKLHRQNWASFLGLNVRKTKFGVFQLLRRLIFSAIHSLSVQKQQRIEVGKYLLSSPQSEPTPGIRFTQRWLDLPAISLAEDHPAYLHVAKLLDQRSDGRVGELADSLGTFVAVHLRVGDYIQLKDIYGEITPRYLENALSLVRRETAINTPVVLFCEDKSQLSSEVLLALGDYRLAGDYLNSDWEEFQLLKRGTAIVGCNSSFSWWAAKTSDALTIVFPEELKGPPLLLPQNSHASNWKRVPN